MVINRKKSPYQGLWMFIPMMVLPSVLLTGLFYYVICKWQPQFCQELNFASAKMLGCGCGICYHISCWLMGVFTDDYLAVKKRLKEFFDNLMVSPGLAFTWYWEDVKTLGLAFWIDVALVMGNIWIFSDAILDFFALYVNK